MSTKKTIQINPDLFSFNKTRKKKEKVIQPKPLIKANSLKKALLKRIKHHAKNRERDYNDSRSKKNMEEEFSNDFHSHLDYLNNIQKNNKTLKRKSRQKEEINNIQANVFLPPELSDVEVSSNLNSIVKENPPYGCLKNGSKPTWREWKRSTQKVIPPTTKMNIHISDENIDNHVEHDFVKNKMLPNTSFHNKYPDTNLISERELKLNNLRSKIKHDELKEKKQKIKKQQENKQLKKKTMKLVHHFGKQKNKVSVLVKNSSTRKNIQKEHSLLKQISIDEVKQYLRKHYLLKVGSNAPNDVLRKMYETAHLSGEIKNINKDNLLHNYMSEEGLDLDN
jgi:hypothetical protein